MQHVISKTTCRAAHLSASLTSFHEHIVSKPYRMATATIPAWWTSSWLLIKDLRVLQNRYSIGALWMMSRIQLLSIATLCDKWLMCVNDILVLPFSYISYANPCSFLFHSSWASNMEQQTRQFVMFRYWDMANAKLIECTVCSKDWRIAPWEKPTQMNWEHQNRLGQKLVIRLTKTRANAFMVGKLKKATISWCLTSWTPMLSTVTTYSLRFRFTRI